MYGCTEVNESKRIEGTLIDSCRLFLRILFRILLSNSHFSWHIHALQGGSYRSGKEGEKGAWFHFLGMDLFLNNIGIHIEKLKRETYMYNPPQ